MMLGQLNEYKAKVQHILQEVERLHQILENIKHENVDIKRDNEELRRHINSGSLQKEKVRMLVCRMTNYSRRPRDSMESLNLKRLRSRS